MVSFNYRLVGEEFLLWCAFITITIRGRRKRRKKSSNWNKDWRHNILIFLGATLLLIIVSSTWKKRKKLAPDSSQNSYIMAILSVSALSKDSSSLVTLRFCINTIHFRIQQSICSENIRLEWIFSHCIVLRLMFGKSFSLNKQN